MTGGAAGGALLVAALAAAAVLLGARPGAVARRRVAAGPRARSLSARSAADALRRAPGRWGWRRPDTDPAALLGAVVTAVAAEVRAGRAPADAWQLVLGVPVGPSGVPAAQDVLGAVLPQHRCPPAGDPSTDQLRRRVAGVLAAGRLAAGLGAPTAGVLEECARALAADADAETAVRGALAGPRQTTSLLTWLPVLGVVLGTLLGADPLGLLLGGGAGTAAGVAGLVLTLVGRRWTGRMVAGARSAGSATGSGGRAAAGSGAGSSGRPPAGVGAGSGGLPFASSRAGSGGHPLASSRAGSGGHPFASSRARLGDTRGSARGGAR
ncbi:hypothetical protein MHY85_09645 [Cellulomonas sp. ACRRI]|uniref:hypothetical protein n=1 Tax=Cellulomonas sp. ACRRI TaxID=2918188 RepID=UPI001EF2A46B|nr:hypothetical protein [Cellulomonas sp. ACRRI]MCG7286231.1 hypothetical protein [Cellulomonas sp. ACRRI]